LLAGAIVAVDPLVAAAAIALLGASYVLIHALTRRHLLRNGRVISQHWQQRAQVVAESFVAIRDIAVHRAQHLATARVTRSSAAIAAAHASTPAIAMAPKYLLECVTGAGLVAAALSAHASGGAGEWQSHLAFLAFSAYRLVPAAQQVFAAVARIQAERPGFDAIVEDLRCAGRRTRTPAAQRCNDWRGAPRRSLRMVGVTYRHSPERPGGVSDVTLEIPAGALVAFTGPNGAGKSTLAEIALGLRAPLAGRVEVDGVELHDGNRSSWLDTVAYVPQHLAFVDGTIAENIAFGAAPNDIDLDRVRDAASRAQLAGVIDSLPAGLATVIGENGALLSGGQRQRLALARALYRLPSLLVVDEGTTALDALTEAQVLDLLAGLRDRCTIIVITHRPSTLRGCDLVFELCEGRLVERRPALPRESAFR
jgi:ABC-type bacteriocin/lantibiotic exporter with double-glycine peptidase domain